MSAAVQYDSHLVESTDGVTVAVHDFGGDGPTLLLAHATGFHGMVLLALATELRHSFRCIAFDQRGHGASGRPAGGSFTWDGFADDALAVVRAMDLDRPSGFGHSAGGAALILAEERCQGTFRDLFCYEPVVLDVAGPLPPEGLPDNPLTIAALKRQEIFASRDAAFRNFSQKAPLSSISPSVLRQYVDYGLADLPGGGVGLKCRREDEAEIYAHGFAHDAFSNLDKITCPVALAYGERTESIGAPFINAMAAKLAGATVLEMPNLGHLGPLEDPGACARAIAGWSGKAPVAPPSVIPGRPPSQEPSAASPSRPTGAAAR